MSNDDGKSVVKNGPHRWKKGESGNPKGNRKSPDGLRLQRVCRKHTTRALNTIIDLLDSGEGHIRLKAAALLLDRGWGKAPLTVTLEGGESPIKHTVEAMTPEERKERLERLLRVSDARPSNK